MGFVFQFFNLIPTLTVLENVLLPAELGGPARTPRPRRRAARARGPRRSRGDAFPTGSPAASSSGWPSRARSCCDPRLVLADEPTGNLDDATGATVMELLDARDAARRQDARCSSTHSREVAARADRVLTIEGGRPPWSTSRRA